MFTAFSTSGQIVVTNTASSGPGSFSEALANVAAGGTIRFAPELARKSIQCDSLSIDKFLTIDGTGVRPALVLTGIEAVLEIRPVTEVTILNVDLMIPVINRGDLEGQSLTVGGLGMTGIDNKVGAHLNLYSCQFFENSVDIQNEGGSVSATSNQIGLFLNGGGAVTAVSNTFNAIQIKAGQFAVSKSHIDAEYSNEGIVVGAGTFTADQVAIGGNAFFDVDVGLSINTNAIVRLNNCSVFNFGETGVLNKGSLWATNCVWTNNAGAGLRNLAPGAAQLENCIFDRNIVRLSNSPGGIENGGSLVVNNSTVSRNENWGDGGGIANRAGGILSITNCVISGNQAVNGCGIFNQGTINAQGVRIEGNSYRKFIADGSGGAIYSPAGNITLVDCNIIGNVCASSGGISKGAGDLTLIRTVVSNNWSEQGSASPDCTGGAGAAISSSLGRVKLVDCTVAANRSPGIFCRTPDDNTYNSEGGAGGISVSGNLEIYRSTIVSNIGNGISHEGGVLTLIQSTIVGNTESGQYSGTFDPLATGGFGAGILAKAILHITNCTIYGNIVSRPNSDAKGGGIYFTGTEFILQNSIVCSNRADLNPDIFGPFSGEHNLVGIDPKLGALANNGGLTQTMLPLEGSPALDAASYSGFATDQRGFPGIVSLFPDIGAAENSNARPMVFTKQISPSGHLIIYVQAAPGLRFQVYGTSDLNLGSAGWQLLGPATEIFPNAGMFSFTDPGDSRLGTRFLAIIPKFD